jgi:hypothetical protein
MANWNTVRFDPNYEEKIDPEILSLCDAINAIPGFETTCSCCGHGLEWPRVWFLASDKNADRLARFILAQEKQLAEATADSEGITHRPYFTVWLRETILPESRVQHRAGYYWIIEIHLNRVFHDTPQAEALQEAVNAITSLANAVTEFN